MQPIEFDKIPFLKEMGWLTKREIAKKITWYSLPGGQPLFLEGEKTEVLWFVRKGSLGAFRTNSVGERELVGHIRSGEPVGEISLISGETQSISVFALRDTELFAIERKIFNKLAVKYPEFMNALAQLMIRRVRQENRIKKLSRPKIFAFFSTSPTIDINSKAEQIAKNLRDMGNKVAVIGDYLNDAQSVNFDALEHENQYILLTAKLGDNLWAQICMRQADRIWIFARTDAKPSLPLLPEIGNEMQKFRLMDLVMLRNIGARAASGALEWSNAAGANRIFNWRQGNASDAQSLARVICGKSVGIVLSGGGARAYAHIGAIRALREAGYEFDFIGGTSMGALIGACVAMGWSDERIEREIWEAFVSSDPLNDYTLPVVALTKGKKVDERLKQHFQDIRIEDLERPFYCVSTNLLSGRIKVHRNGILRKALRATISIPGLLPPVVTDDEILIDGAALNNFPIDIMSLSHYGINIGVDAAQQSALVASEFKSPKKFIEWVAGNGIHATPPIVELLMSAATAPINHIKQGITPEIMVNPKLGNIALRDWKAFDTAIEAGYNAVKDCLKCK